MASQLVPTYVGLVGTTQDALLLFEACLAGMLPCVTHRPNDRERAGLIQSGNVFVYHEKSTGIKRWTDDKNWSPSRVQREAQEIKIRDSSVEAPCASASLPISLHQDRRSVPGLVEPKEFGRACC